MSEKEIIDPFIHTIEKLSSFDSIDLELDLEGKRFRDAITGDLESVSDEEEDYHGTP